MTTWLHHNRNPESHLDDDGGYNDDGYNDGDDDGGDDDVDDDYGGYW